MIKYSSLRSSPKKASFAFPTANPKVVDKRCQHLLKKNGFLAVTQIVYLVNNPPSPLVQYFDNAEQLIEDVR